MLVCVSFLLEQTALVFIPMFLLPFILSLLIAINITHIIALATKRASFANYFLLRNVLQITIVFCWCKFWIILIFLFSSSRISILFARVLVIFDCFVFKIQLFLHWWKLWLFVFWWKFPVAHSLQAGSKSLWRSKRTTIYVIILIIIKKFVKLSSS